MQRISGETLCASVSSEHYVQPRTKKPTWQNTHRYSTTSAYSLTSPSAPPRCPLSSHPTISRESRDQVFRDSSSTDILRCQGVKTIARSLRGAIRLVSSAWLVLKWRWQTALAAVRWRPLQTPPQKCASISCGWIPSAARISTTTSFDASRTALFASFMVCPNKASIQGSSFRISSGEAKMK